MLSIVWPCPAKESAVNNAAAMPAQGFRVLEFQKKIGKLSIIHPGEDLGAKKIKTTPFGFAEGAVRVKGGTQLQLEGNQELVENPALLSALPPDAFACMRLHGLEADDRTAEALSRFTGLRRLELSETEITDAGVARLAPLKHLEGLFLSACRMKGKTLGKLQPMPKLRWLQISKNEIDPATLKALAGFPSLTVLRLDQTRIQNKDLVHLSGLKNLNYLYLGGNHLVSSRGLPYLMALKKLESIDLEDTAVDAAGLVQLKKMPFLKRIYLPDRLTQSDVAYLEKSVPGKLWVLPAFTIDRKDAETIFAPLH